MENLDIKVTQLGMAMAKTNIVLEARKPEAIERQLAALKSITKEIDRIRVEVEAKKLAAKEEIAEIETWNTHLDQKLEEADNEIMKVRKWLDDREKEAEVLAREEKLKFEEKLHRAKLEWQTELQASQTSQHTVHHTQIPGGDIQAKLPKLVITKFDGTFMDWPRFWGQFTETIDKTGVASITKFSYLRELLDIKVRRTIEALPFTSEGYNRAKSILQEKYGKESEIIKAYTKEILELPLVSNANPRKISEFSEKLTYCVQALQTLKKLEQVNGVVSMTLDKLPAIRGDLVRTDPEWENWDFAKFSEAVRLWVRRNPVDAMRNEREPEQPTKKNTRQTKIYHAHREDPKLRSCVFCGENHKPVECTNVTDQKANTSQQEVVF